MIECGISGTFPDAMMDLAKMNHKQYTGLSLNKMAKNELSKPFRLRSANAIRVSK